MSREHMTVNSYGEVLTVSAACKYEATKATLLVRFGQVLGLES